MSPWCARGEPFARAARPPSGAASARATPTRRESQPRAFPPALVEDSACLRTLARCTRRPLYPVGAMAGESGLAIEAKGLVKAFDGKRAVDGIDLAVPEGSIYGILGPNGAGKTTTLRMLLGIIEPDVGHAQPARPRPAARGGAGGRLSARGARPLSGDDGRRGDRLHGRAARPAARGRPAQARRDAAQARTASAIMSKQADQEPVQGHGADRPAARHDRPQAQADRARRALLRPRRDQPGQARAADPRRGGGRARRSSSRPMSSPMPSGCASGSRSSPRARSAFEGAVDEARDRLRPQVRLQHPRRGRAVARRASRRRRAASAATGSSSCPRAAPSRCSRR